MDKTSFYFAQHNTQVIKEANAKSQINAQFCFRYFIHFDAKRGYRYISDIAIDDVSLSPECFGLNIPPEELNGYNYWNPYEERVVGRETHKHFVNETSKTNNEKYNINT